MFKTINRNIKKFNKLSNWLKISISLIIVLSVYKILEEKREQFIQEKEFILKEGPQVYDKFYSEIYDDLIYDKVKNEYEVGEIINNTKPTSQSRLLDVGSGSGEIVSLFNKKGINAQGLEISDAMVKRSRKKFPQLKIKKDDATKVMLYPANSFTHITCLYFTIYYIKNKQQFFKNCYDWLMPGGALIINLVNRNKFDPILNAADPLVWVSPQKYAKKRITSSIIKFKDFQYKANFSLDKNDNLAEFTETMKDDKTGNVRKNIHKLFMPTQKHIISLAKEVGFILKGKIDLVNIQYEYQYLYILYKPE
jgi:ubiquinone/menaquinone biosynthesis C-methylase UbiE